MTLCYESVHVVREKLADNLGRKHITDLEIKQLDLLISSVQRALRNPEGIYL